MITDQLRNAALYRNLHPRLATALDWLTTADLTGLPIGKTSIEGDAIFALVQEYTPKDASLVKLEAHRDFWDVQYVVSGAERMGWVNLADVVEVEPYNVAQDVAFFTGSASFIRVPAGSFAIFGPNDVHMPGVALENQEAIGEVRKIVIKVRLDVT